MDETLKRMKVTPTTIPVAGGQAVEDVGRSTFAGAPRKALGWCRKTCSVRIVPQARLSREFQGREMTRITCLMAILALVSACTAPGPPASPLPAGHQPDEETAVLEAMDRYMIAISTNDLEAMATMQTPEGMTYRARATEGGKMDIVAHPNSYWVDPSQDDGRSHRERYWSPTVLLRGGIAVVWAPYEYWIDAKTSHCGVDVFDFVKIGGVWRVANSMWTVEPNACAELRPAEVLQLRPHN